MPILDAVNDKLQAALGPLEPGVWIVGVSGGIDSVALLLALCRYRPDITPVVAHLDHQTRGAESDADREFVINLARQLDVESVVSRIDEWPDLSSTNLEARYRQARLALFSREASRYQARGVLLAQHADDRAETTLLRVLRGGEPWAVAGMRRDRRIGSLRVVRPLLDLRRAELERFVADAGTGWREDSSNQSDAFARNRVRKFLRDHPHLAPLLVELAEAAEVVRQWVDADSPQLPDTIKVAQLAELPDPLARHAVRQWLSAHGIESDAILPAHVDRLILMARDRATPAVFTLPGGRLARRQRDSITLSPVGQATN